MRWALERSRLWKWGCN